MKKSKLTAVFDGIRKGLSLYASCLKVGMSTREFYKTLAKDSVAMEEFQLALSDYADQCMDDIRALAQGLRDGEIDNSTAKLLIETEKWLAQKVCPEPFGGFNSSYDDGQTREILVKFVA